MKLHYSPTSPFVRKVLVCAHERGLAGEIELAPPATLFDGTLARDNPLEKVPTLVPDDGPPLYDSLVIACHLDGLGSGPRLLPEAPPARMAVLRRHALANGMMDAAVAWVMEKRRPEGMVWQRALDRQQGKIARGLDALEGEAAAFVGALDVAAISAGCLLGYVDFRMGAMAWRDGRPALADWFAAFRERPSMVGTEPRDPPP